MASTVIKTKYSANIGKIDIGSINIISNVLFNKVVDPETTIVVPVNISINQEIDPDYIVLWAKSSTIQPTRVDGAKIVSIVDNIVTVNVPSINLPQIPDVLYELELALKI